MRFGLVSFNLLEQLGYFKIKMYDFNREMCVDYYNVFTEDACTGSMCNTYSKLVEITKKYKPY